MDHALVSAAMLSHRYIADRFLPDKAIDLVDEACALIKTELAGNGALAQHLSQYIGGIHPMSLRRYNAVYGVKSCSSR